MSELDRLISILDKKPLRGAIAISVGVNPYAAVAEFAVGALASALSVYSPALLMKINGALGAKEPINLTIDDVLALNKTQQSVTLQSNANLQTFDAPSEWSFAEEAAAPTEDVALADLEKALADAEASGDDAAADGIRRLIIVVKAHGVGDDLRTEISHIAGFARGKAIPQSLLMFQGAIMSEAQETASGITMAAEDIESILRYGKLPDPGDKCLALRARVRQMIDALNMAKIAFKVGWFSPKSEAILVRAVQYLDNWCSGTYGPGPMTN